MALGSGEQIRAGIVTDADGRQIVKIDDIINIEEVTVSNEVEVKNAAGDPIPVSGTVTVNHPNTTVEDGRKVVTTSGTAVALAASTACKEVVVTAETDNTGIVVVGGSTVVAALSTRRGTPLAAGDSMTLRISNLANVFIDSTVNGDGVTFTYLA